jgi:glycosyltransferase involved in cell wall biosynthesis
MPAHSWKDGVVRLLMKWLYPFADQVVAISRGVQDDLHKWIGLPPGKVRTIYNPVVTTGLSGLASAPIPHPWLAQGEPPVVLGVGRLTEQKDFASLIRAFATVRKTRRCRLVILGEGELRAELEALVNELRLDDDVLMPGFQNNPFAWMGRAAVFVFSSVFEGLGGALIQAMACGTPVVSTDCPSGPAEILEDGKWGSLVPVGDVQALARAITDTLDADSHPDVRLRAAFFSDQRSVDDYLEVCFPDRTPDRLPVRA